MFSKKWISLSVVALASFQFIACDKFLRSSKSPEEENKVVVIDVGAEVQCLKDVPSQLKLFLNDEASANDVAGAVGCLQEALRTFMSSYKGNDPSSYTGPEIQHFFNRYLLKENQVSDKFLSEIMKTKTALVGGVTERFTRDEMERFIQFLGSFGDQLQSLRGQMKILLWKTQQGAASEAQVLQAQKITQSLVIFFLDNSKLTSAKYELNDLVTLIEELDNFVGDKEGISSVFKWVPLIKDVKYLFLGESSGLSNMTEWKKAFVWVVDAYFAILKFHYHLNKLEFEEPEDWNKLMIWTDEIFRLIDISPEMQNQKILEADKIDALIDRVWGLKLFKHPFDETMAKEVYRKLIANVLESNMPRGRSSEITGLSQQNFRVLRQEYRAWRISEKFIVDAFLKFKRLNLKKNAPNLRQEANAFNYKAFIASMKVTPLEQEELEQSWMDFHKLVWLKFPVLANEKTKLVMDYDLQSKSTSLQGAHLLNFNRTYVRMLVRGYGEKTQEKLFDNKITKQRFIDFEKDFWHFTRKLGLFDPRTQEAAPRTFSEADFMAYNGNGDDLMSPIEAIEVLSMMFSGGKHMIAELEEDVAKFDVALQKFPMAGKCYDKQLDIFGRKIMTEACLKAVYRANAGKYFEAMPNTAKFIKSLNDVEFEEYYQAILIPAMLEKHRPGFMEVSEARSILVIMHYLESLMVVYDTNKDSYLSKDELLEAFPRFKPFIVKMSPAGNWFAGDVFLYLVYRGEKPTLTSLPGFIAEKFQGKLGKASRLNLVKVLGLLKAEAKAPMKPEIQ